MRCEPRECNSVAATGQGYEPANHANRRDDSNRNTASQPTLTDVLSSLFASIGVIRGRARSHRYSRFGRQNPLLRSGDQSCARASVAWRLGRPKCFPSVTRRRCEQRFRGRFQDLALSKIHHEQTILFLLRKVSEDETCRPQDSAIDSAGNLLAKARVFAAQFQKIDGQVVELAILFSLAEIQFAPSKRLRVIGRGQTAPCLFLGNR